MYLLCFFCFFFFNDTATTEIYTLSLHDALPIYGPPLSDAHDQISCPRPLSYIDRKSTRLNSSHLVISYAVFCLKKKKVECHRYPAGPRVFALPRPALRLPDHEPARGRVFPFFFLMIRRPPRSTLFPNTTLFRSTSPNSVVEVREKFNSELTISLARKVCLDRKSTRLNSSHLVISYAVFCLKKKNEKDSISAVVRYNANNLLRHR